MTPEQQILVTEAVATLEQAQMLQNMVLTTEVAYEYSINKYATVLSHILGELGFILNNLNESVGN